MTNLFASAALAILQVGPFPGQGAMPEVPEELRDRPPRSENVEQAPPSELANCLRQASANPEMALDTAQRWREGAQSQLEMAQSAHCLGLALVQSNRMDEAREAFELASAEAPAENPTYSARLAAMAGNAAMAQGDAEGALPLLDRAGELALSAGDGELGADLRVDLARVLVRLNRAEDAASALAEAREADPLDAQAWLLSATLSRRLERLGEAQDQIERAATLAPRDAQVGLEAGVIAAMSGRAPDARASFQSVIDIAPDSPEAGRAQTYLEQLDTAATE